MPNRYYILAFLTALSISNTSLAQNNANQTNQSFSKAKKMLEKKVYSQIPRTTIYCLASFNNKKKITNANGFKSTKHKKRQKKIEWEHVVPAENFGRAFVEWREGNQACIKKGKAYRGRRCAQKTNKAYRFMQADMYNLYPAIGAVNALRSNYSFYSQISAPQQQFGQCSIKIKNKSVQPPNYARGKIARAYLYMESVYPNYKIGRQKRELQAWHKRYPVTESECQRTKIIENIQGNENKIVKSACRNVGFW